MVPPLLGREIPLLQMARSALTDQAKKLITVSAVTHGTHHCTALTLPLPTPQDEGVRAECWVVGIISLEHSGRGGSDGLHIDLLVEVTAPSGGVWEAVPEGEEYHWLVQRLDRDGGCIHFVDLNR